MRETDSLRLWMTLNKQRFYKRFSLSRWTNTAARFAKNCAFHQYDYTAGLEKPSRPRQLICVVVKLKVGYNRQLTGGPERTRADPSRTELTWPKGSVFQIDVTGPSPYWLPIRCDHSIAWLMRFTISLSYYAHCDWSAKIWSGSCRRNVPKRSRQWTCKKLRFPKICNDFELTRLAFDLR